MTNRLGPSFDADALAAGATWDDEPARNGFGRLVDAIEGTLFAFFATVVMSVPLSVCGVLLFKEGLKGLLPQAAAWLVIVLWIVLDAPLIGRAWTAVVRGYHPVAVQAALRQPRWPRPLRPLVALWWLAHFLLGAGSGLAMEASAYSVGATGDTAIAMTVVVFMYTLAANGYLAHSVAAIGASDRAVRATWRWRLAIDAAIVLAAWAVGTARTP